MKIWSVANGDLRLEANRKCWPVEACCPAVSERQPPMYFKLGGGTIKGISKPGPIV